MAKPESKKRDEYTVVLENLRGDFRVFGEALSGVGDEVKGNSKRLDKVESRLGGVESRLGNVESRLDGVDSELDFIKSELALIRHNQVTRDEFRLLETRVLRLEKHRG